MWLILNLVVLVVYLTGLTLALQVILALSGKTRKDILLFPGLTTDGCESSQPECLQDTGSALRSLMRSVVILGYCGGVMAELRCSLCNTGTRRVKQRSDKIAEDV